MRMTRLALAAALLLGASFASAEDHLVAKEVAGARLAQAAAEQAWDRALIGEALASDAAGRTAARLGYDIRDVRAAALTLSDAEARDLTLRARALQRDPAAGLTSDVNQLLVIFLIVAIVILVLKAVD